MLLSFLIDQLQQHSCQLYKQARKALRVQKVMWESMRSVIRLIEISDWETLWRLLGSNGSKNRYSDFQIPVESNQSARFTASRSFSPLQITNRPIDHKRSQPRSALIIYRCNSYHDGSWQGIAGVG